MIDVSNEGLLHQKSRKNMISFDSISEKQEESSNSSIRNSRFGKSRVTLNKNQSLMKSNIECSKDGINTSINDVSIRKRKRSTIKHVKKKSINESNNENNNNFRSFKRVENKKKTTANFIMKRTSFQHNNNNFAFYNQVKNDEKRRSSKNVGALYLMGRTTLKDKKSFNVSNKSPLSSLYGNKSSVVEQNYAKNKSVNLRN